MIHIVEMFGDRFKLVPTYGVMEQISLRYAQYHGASDNMVEGETERLRIKQRKANSLGTSIQMELTDGELVSKKWIPQKKTISTGTKRTMFLVNLYLSRSLASFEFLN